MRSSVLRGVHLLNIRKVMDSGLSTPFSSGRPEVADSQGRCFSAGQGNRCAHSRGMTQRKELAACCLVIGFMSVSAIGQSSRPRTVTLMAQVAPVMRIAVDGSAAQRIYSAIPINETELEILIEARMTSSGVVNIPVLLSSNTKNYTLQALCDDAVSGEIELVNGERSAQEIVARPKPLQRQVTFAMGKTASANRPARATIQIRMASSRLRLRLKIQPLVM